MKKTLLVSILILVLVVSMVAGTMATYTRSLDYSGDVTAKAFDIRETTNTDIDIKLAPSETQSWAFTLTNTLDDGTATEVDMDVATSITLPAEFAAVEVKLYSIGEDGSRTEVAAVKNGNTLTFQQDDWSQANVAKTQAYEADFTWQGSSDDADTAMGLAQTTGVVTATITGTQSV